MRWFGPRLTIGLLIMSWLCPGAARAAGEATATAPERRSVSVPPRLEIRPLGPVMPVRPWPVPRGYDYLAVKPVVVELLKRFDPRFFYFAGVGRTPAPVMGMLDAISRDLGRGIPASGLDGYNRRREVDRDYAHFAEHFDIFIPREVVKGHRTILLLDYTRGWTLTNFARPLRRYLREQGSTAGVATLTLRNDIPGFTADYRLRSPEQFYSFGTHRLAEFIYDEHVIGRDSPTELIPNPVWWAMIANFKLSILNDPSIGDLLTRALPTQHPDLYSSVFSSSMARPPANASNKDR